MKPVSPFALALLLLCSSSRSLSKTLLDPSQLEEVTYDFVIVGAGNAGLVLANRLTEDPKTKVLVIEAGVSDKNILSVMAPFLGPSVTPGTPYDWNYTVVPQPGLDGRTYPYPRGRLLGGSTSANYMIHQYCTHEDWDRMANVSGDSGWSWNNMKQYIARHEKFIPILEGENIMNQFIPSLHSFKGELSVSLPVKSQPIDARVVNTTQQLSEFPFNKDISGINNSLLGIGWAQSSMANGSRASSSTSYLANANDRPNLTVLINTMVTKLVSNHSFAGTKSFRDVLLTDSRTFSVSRLHQVHAKKEVILSAGAIGTPQILQLSGIGDPTVLRRLGIPVSVNNPHVGQNMQDHPLLPNIFTAVGDTSFDHILRNATEMASAINEWAQNRTGIISNNVVNNIGFARLNSTVLKEFADPSAGPRTPHYEMIFANFWLDPVIPIPSDGSYFTILTALVTPTSRGSVTIRSTNPFDAPLINPNMLNTSFDIMAIRESIRAVKRFAAAPAWSGYINGSFGSLAGTSDAELDAHARQHTSTVFHPSSTASMASAMSNMGVVNPDLTVKGTAGLRIVDLSVFPYIPSCHPQGPVYMLAERAADVIKGIA